MLNSLILKKLKGEGDIIVRNRNTRDSVNIIVKKKQTRKEVPKSHLTIKNY